MFMGSICAYASFSCYSSQLNWNHKSGSEYLFSSHYNISDLSIIAADGSLQLFDSKQELSLNYINRFDYHSILGWISYNGMGGRYQYNNIPNMVLGIKGALNNNRFVEVYNNWFRRFEIEDPYMRKSGRHKSDINYGIRNYCDIFFKPLEGFTWGFWNYISIGENDYMSPSLLQDVTEQEAGNDLSSSSFEYPELIIQSTPRIIYELKGDFNKLVIELYMDSRFYLVNSVDINNQDYQYFFKFVAAPQWIVNWSGRYSQFYMYSAATAEIMQHLEDVQWIFKTSPKIDWNVKRFHFGLSGAGFDFNDEIGIVFDNNELFAFKKSGSYNALIFALKGYFIFDIFHFLSSGFESSFRGGMINGASTNYMDEQTLCFFLQTQLNISENWSLTAKASGEFINFGSDLDSVEPLPDENIFRLSLIISR